jgi:hypothetical protein
MTTSIFNKYCQDIYVDWCNNYLSVEFMADDYELTPEILNPLINHGRKIHSGYTVLDGVYEPPQDNQMSA